MVPENLLELWKTVREGQDPAKDSLLRGPFSHRPDVKGDLSVQKCVLHCWSERFNFAAMQGGSHCYCSSHVEELMTVRDWFCRERCVGTCREMCGGRVAMSVYETGYEKEPQQLLSFSNDIVKAGMVGCYYKIGEARLCSSSREHHVKPAIRSGRMTPQLCALYCAAGGEKLKNDVAVVTAKDACCCGTNTQLATSGQDLQGVPLDQCAMACVGGSHSTCVGEGVLNGRVEQLISAYIIPKMLSVGMPVVPAAVFQTDNGWLYPKFVDSFDVSEETLMKEDKELEELEMGGEKKTEEIKTNRTVGEHATKLQSGPIVYPVNTGAEVKDVPKETHGGGTNLIVVGAVTVSILLFGASVGYAIQRRYDMDIDFRSCVL
ncbi:hypothetical protein C0Q70_14298 [Pomacea canaliculata]|uniref:WSC domain-containing protein n=1 Tax=Pomacea canaliculata TaxID=400727 RepID=A0A2T7NZM5_POMCA|nr:hypothetical protein C0Q70_14298 [Pomacea canaliculata]